jgi:hypothetical protein
MLLRASTVNVVSLVQSKSPSLSRLCPPPLAGCNDPELIRSTVDACVWLGSIPGFPLFGTCASLVDMVMEDVDGGEGGVKNYDRPVFLPSNLDIMTGTISKALDGQESRPLCPPGLRQTKKDFWTGCLKI